MFYQVKILDAQGKVKKVISSNKLSHNHWKQNDQAQDHKLTVEFDELEEESLNTQTVGGKVSLFKLDESVD
ncbi:hypothetical protein [Nitrospina gracilis]|uniref:hypothetical protein n=1 Tax=Nitrospina gracilis TaxID=35801 RepID=UPI001F1E2736|nr:hypothetical protein [Nitrospina gracilis]MCF8721030.1 hypothetical protein [Nitrospina gracilis Nb-211]